MGPAPASAVVYVTCQRHDGVSRRPRPVPSRFGISRLVTAQSNLPTTMVRCVVGAMARALTPTSMLCPARHRQRRDGVSRRTRPVADHAGPPLLVGTPTRALAAPSELHPAGRRIALKPPYPRHRPLLRSLERTWKGVKQRLCDVAEPSSDTPVVMPSGMLSWSTGLIKFQACMPQGHASSLNPHQSRAGGGFSVPAPFSRALRPGRRERSRTSPISQEPGWRCHHPLIPTVASSHALQSSCQVIKPEVLALASTSPCPPLVGVFLFQPCSAANWRNYLRLRPLLVAFQRHLQAHDPGPPSAPLAGDFCSRPQQLGSTRSGISCYDV